MRPGSIVVDLAAGPLGGNVTGSVAGKSIVTENGVTVVGADDLPSRMASAASAAYAHNVAALLAHLTQSGALSLVGDDPVRAGVIVTRDGAVVQHAVRRLLDPSTTLTPGAGHEPEPVH